MPAIKGAFYINRQRLEVLARAPSQLVAFVALRTGLPYCTHQLPSYLYSIFLNVLMHLYILRNVFM